MKLIILLFTSCFFLFGQTPDEQVLVEPLDAYETPHDALMTEHPDAEEIERSENHSIYKLPGRERVGIFRRGLSYVDELGQIQRSAPTLWRTERGWMVKRGPALVVVAKPPTGTNFWLGVFQRNVGPRKGFAMRLGDTVTRVGRAVQFSNGGLSWTAAIWGRGFAMSSETDDAPQGQVIHAWPYLSFGDVTVSVTDAGHLIVGNKFRITRAVMVGANRQKYPCSKWNIQGDQVGFACNDTDLPTDAYPYFIDPDGNYYQDAYTDDGYVKRAGCSGYYVNSGCTSSSGDWETEAEVSGSKNGSTYDMQQALFKFDTSGLPDGATISYTQLVAKVKKGFITNSGFDFDIQVVSTSLWPISDGVFTWSLDGSSKYDEGNFPASTYEWRWMTEAGSNSQVNKTGDTGVVMAAYSGNSTPTGLNFVYVMTQDSSSDPYFLVVYTLGGPMVITASDDD